MCRCGVGLNPLKVVQGRESTSLCHGQIGTLRRKRQALKSVGVFLLKKKKKQGSKMSPSL